MQFNPAAFLEGKLQTEDKALIAEAIPLMKWCHYKRGDLIVKEGNPIADYRFLASEGVVRCIYHTAAGKEITECIVSKPGSCLMPSAVLSAPSPVDMEALTDVDIVSFSIQAVAKLELKYPQILRMENQVLTECWQEQWELKRIRYEYNTLERYRWFCKKYPGASGKLKNKHIASFLDMTPPTLSNVRRQLAEELAEEE